MNVSYYILTIFFSLEGKNARLVRHAIAIPHTNQKRICCVPEKMERVNVEK